MNGNRGHSGRAREPGLKPESGGDEGLWELRARSTQFPFCSEFPSPAEALREGSVQTHPQPEKGGPWAEEDRQGREEVGLWSTGA